MADLDKKIQKSQPDLVQSVLEAFEKRSVDRVDMLITNALKQLKGSRFKPDQSICIGLFYLARIQPKIFSQSNTLKEFLKTHIKRDGVPANIKGNKTDFFLPVLAANILLASCDCPDVRSTILTRIGQWISSNQKLNELVQHVLAILCIRCHDDEATVKTLIDMRHQWFDFLESNFDTYGRVAPDLARSIRCLLGGTGSCESFVANLTFLIKHDSDVVGLCTTVSRFIVQKPITFSSIMANKEHSQKLVSTIYEVFEAYFQQNVCDSKDSIKKDEIDQLIIFNLSTQSHVLALDKTVISALLWLMSRDQANTTEEHPHMQNFLSHWLAEAKVNPNLSNIVFVDVTLTTPHQFPTRLLTSMIGSKNHLIHELAIFNAAPTQLVEIALTFGLPTSLLDVIFERLGNLTTSDLAKADLRDCIYFNEILDYYTEIGVKRVERLRDLLSDVDPMEQDCKKIEQPEIEMKVKKEIT